MIYCRDREIFRYWKYIKIIYQAMYTYKDLESNTEAILVQQRFTYNYKQRSFRDLKRYLWVKLLIFIEVYDN